MNEKHRLASLNAKANPAPYDRHEQTTMKKIFIRLAAIAIGTILLAPVSAGAALLVVDTLADELNNDGDCSLREAVVASNTNSVTDQCGVGQILGTEEIFIDLNGTILLDSSLFVTQEVTIYGRGRNATTLSGQGLTNHFQVQLSGTSQSFELRDIALVDGQANGEGGSIFLADAGSVNIDGVLFLNNTSLGSAGLGGAISSRLPNNNNTSLTIERSIFAANQSGSNGGAIGFAVNSINDPPETFVIREASFVNNEAAGILGGAVYSVNVPIVIIDNSLFRNNSAVSTGGAVHLETLPGGLGFNQIDSSTFQDNTSGESGGAISNRDGTSIIRNSTFTRNEAAEGAAIAADYEATTIVLHSTFIDNGSSEFNNGSVLHVNLDAEIDLGHSIVYTDGAGMRPECSDAGGNGTYTSLGYNIDTSGTCAGHATDNPMTDPNLAPLGDYGDDTDFLVLQTFLPKTGSPAIEGGQLGPCDGGLSSGLTKDQRGQARPNFLRCDIGAVEYQFANDPDAFNLIVEIGSGAGTVTSNPDGIDCTGTCVENFLDGTQVALSATPAPGFEFSGWTDDCSGTGPCQVTMTTGRRVVANFIQTGFSLETLIDGNAPGSIISLPEGIDCPGDCTETYPEDTVVSLTPMAHAGGRFLHWAGDCTGSSACNVTMAGMRRVIGVFVDNDTIFIDGYE